MKRLLYLLLCAMLLTGCTTTNENAADETELVIEVEFEDEEETETVCNHEYEYWYSTGGEEGDCIEKVCIYCGDTLSHPLDAEDDPEFDMDELSYLIPEESTSN